MNKPPKVLVMRFSSLGDVVLATAAVEALAAGIPGVEIHVLTKPKFREVFSGLPQVSRVLRWVPSAGFFALARQLRELQYDWIVDLHASLRSRLLRPLVRGARWSVYRKGALRRRIAVRLGRPRWLEVGRHVVDRYIEALAPMKVPYKRWLPRMLPGEDAAHRMRTRLVSEGWDGAAPLIAMAPGAHWATKAWPGEHWAALIGTVTTEGWGIPVLLGGPEEQGLCTQILGETNGAGINLAGRTSIEETAAVLSLCDALVTNDSAPLHMATAVGTRVLALFGPTHRDFGFFPLGPGDVLLEEALACRPCSLHGDARCPEGHHRCLRDISPATVTEALRIMLLGSATAEARAAVREDALPASTGSSPDNTTPDGP